MGLLVVVLLVEVEEELAFDLAVVIVIGPRGTLQGCDGRAVCN